MGKNQSASGLTNIIQYNNSGITFVSGSTVLMAISSSGAITTTGVISGSDAANAISASYAQAATSASFASVATSASFASNATSASQAQNAVSSSFATNAANSNLLDSKDSTEFAITGSNIFTGIQYITDTSNPNGFGASASIYTDGGLRVTKDTYVSGTMFVNNLTVFGTQSINYITSSQLNISTNIISVNTDTPSIRFGGLSVYDSGSTGLTGSMLWDSERDHWVYSNPSGSSYSGGMIMSGPRSAALGSEQGTLNNFVMKGQGGDHITSSQIIDDGTTVRIPGNLQVTGSIVLSSALTGSSAMFSGNIAIGTNPASNDLGALIRLPNNNAIRWRNSTNSADFGFYLATTNLFSFDTGINVVGAAAFSGSVTANGLLSGGNSSPSTSYNAGSWFTGDGLVVGNISSVCGIQLNSSPTSTLSAIRFGDGDGANNLYDQGFIIYRHTTNAMLFGTSRNTAMVITSGGNAGIGTTSPFSRLHVQDSDVNTGTIAIGSSLYPSLIFSSASSGEFRLDNRTSFGGFITFYPNGQDTTLGNEAMRITSGRVVTIGKIDQSGNAALTIKSPAGGNTGVILIEGDTTNNGWGMYAVTSDEFVITRFTNGTYSDKLRITSGGNLNFNYDNTAAAYIHINQATGQDGAILFQRNLINRFQQALSTPGDALLFYSYQIGTTAFRINLDGSAALAGALTQNASDRRLKKNITNIPNALDKIKTLNGVSFTWENNIFKTERTNDIGVIAQEIQNVLPEAVTLAPFDSDEEGNSKSGDNYLTVYYEKIIPLLIEGIKELSAKVDAQAAEIDELKNK
jgi:hypothetical protein